ncbi:hypothetical protein BWQ96_02445 [Gracilariopsis chorda]|uniref:Uncharacterized protein n=1 Tax=Gracilariopsis chorda TaxID=448386 RepID=A0A2V3J0C9_9FLOR|nr:hypothetical protein BWQ96_02445 [Gracilariopsis chorda]|eukprot:PXF47763.1 hypothetical protein BWQ96_02445 [Gracilariopsis chorda]
MANALPQAPDDLPPAPKFWGPFRPLFGGHTLFEAATSCFLPTFVVFVWRFVFSCFLLTTLVYFAVTGVYQFQFYSVWVHIGLAISFFALSMCSFVFLLQKEHRPESSRLAFASILLYQIFATATLFLDVVFWALLHEYDEAPSFAVVVQHAANLAMVVVDLLLALRIQFKLIYCVCFVLFTLTYLAFMWIRFAVTDSFVYDFTDYRQHAAAITVAYYIGTVAWAFAAAFVMFLISRLSRVPFVKVRSTFSKDGSPASHRNRYFAFV